MAENVVDLPSRVVQIMDRARLKQCGQAIDGEVRDSPAVCTGPTSRPVIGEPIESQIS